MRPEDGGERIRASRERELNAKMRPRLASPFELAVVGVTFQEGYPENCYALEALNFEAERVGERLAVVLIREPDNEHDPNCVAVHCPSLTEHGLIGKITRPLAARLAPELDAGIQWQGELSSIRIHADHLDRPGIDIRIKRIG